LYFSRFFANTFADQVFYRALLLAKNNARKGAYFGTVLSNPCLFLLSQSLFFFGDSLVMAWYRKRSICKVSAVISQVSAIHADLWYRQSIDIGRYGIMKV